MFVVRRLTPRVHSLARSASTKFTKSHEYIRLDGDIGVVGITEHAAKALGYLLTHSLTNSTFIHAPTYFRITHEFTYLLSYLRI